ncbi:hypothetical protein [Enterocloster bolteae]|uniref:hypothetical protein n=1 Tax=Enterocloster bolteae TaxID=208479 RepID=UPI002A80C775|nr:hypothetical protein [Enterocloster bolteae]
MSSGVRDTETPEGRKLKKMLKELAELQVRVGFQHGENTENGVDMCDIAAFNELGTENSPSRPFLRKSVDENQEKINAFLQGTKADLLSGKSAEMVLKEIGIFQKDLVQEKITEGSYAPNAESTIRRKGSNKPLIDSGKMRQSVNYVIKKKGEE